MAEPFQIITAMPDSGLFNFPPTNNAPILPPAHQASSVMHPFNIPDHLFTAALDARVPLTIAATYAITVKLLTKYNKARGKKPWGIARTGVFHVFVVVHNIFLAVYSAWTFWGMLSGMRRSIASPLGPEGLAGMADSFCRLHGAPGLGNSVFYDESTSAWVSEVENPVVNSLTGAPSNLTPGRMWNEGLAYYGWLFYLSKFYEVLDTFIILAKGKPSSTLQTYHHAGAMMCMWAGMRYMSAPIWMFVLINSFIHALMYTYYTVTAFSIKVPMGIKRTLTTLQITQFLVGASNTMFHSFVYYVAPVVVTKKAVTAAVIDHVGEAAATAAAGAASESTGAFDSLRKLVFGAVADTIDAATAAVVAPSAPSAPAIQSPETETVHITQPCIATTGETFAIWLNVLYLAPLTYLFVSFFIASYVKRSNAASKAAVPGKGRADRRLSSNVTTLAEEAGWDAAKSIEKEVYGGEKMLDGGSAVDDTPAAPAVKATRSPRRRG